MLNINKKCIKNTDVVASEIKYILTQNIDNQNNDNVLPLCLSFSNVDAYLIEENENKNLIFALTEKKQQAPGNYWTPTQKMVQTKLKTYVHLLTP